MAHYVFPADIAAFVDTGIFILADGSRALTADWDIGAGNKIQAETIQARSNLGLSLLEDGGAGMIIQDSTGYVGIGVASPLAQLHVDGDQVRFPDGSVIAGNDPGIAFHSYPDSGMAADDKNLGFWESGTLALVFSTWLKDVRVPSDFRFGFSSATDNNSPADTLLYRHAAGVVASYQDFYVTGMMGIGDAPLTTLYIDSPTGIDAVKIITDNSAEVTIDEWGQLNFVHSGVGIGYDDNISQVSFHSLTDLYLTSGKADTDPYDILLLPSDTGMVGIGTDSPASPVDINADVLRLRIIKTPSSASDTGNQGDICWDSSYLYVCVATDTWKRAPLSTW